MFLHGAQSEFVCTNPEWAAGVDAVTRTAAKQLGLHPANVKALPYKLLVYAPGDHFLPHKDTEKEPRQFGSLVIQLPSMHSGGALIVKHADQSWTHDFGVSTGMSQFKCHYAAHYADVEHQVSPVTSGYRVLITYNMVWTRDDLPTPCCANVGDDSMVASVAEGVRAWDLGDDGLFLLALEHEYTQQSLSRNGVQALKGKDRRLSQLLQAANALLPHGLQLAQYIVRMNSTQRRVTARHISPRTSCATARAWSGSPTAPQSLRLTASGTARTARSARGRSG